LVTKKALSLFDSLNIMSKREQEARHEIYLEKYIKKVDIEASLINELVFNQILPACLRAQTDLMTNIKTGIEAGLPKTQMKTQQQLLATVSGHINEVYTLLEKLNNEREKAHQKKTTREVAIYLCDKVKPLFLEIRSHVDDLELYVEDKYWPLPKYREILFHR
jgi:glutamine synthetase